jgi:hypothetical protein
LKLVKNVNTNVNIVNTNVNNVNNIKDNENINISLKIIKCEKCDSIFSSRQAKYLHKKKCKILYYILPIILII